MTIGEIKVGYICNTVLPVAVDWNPNQEINKNIYNIGIIPMRLLVVL